MGKQVSKRELQLEARKENLGEVLEALDELLEAADCPMKIQMQVDVAVEESCPTCHGTGKIKSSILFTDQLESKIDRLVNQIGIKRFSLHVHPYVAAYINQGVVSLKLKWQLKYGLGCRIVPSQKLAFLQYEFYDSKRQFIDMREANEVSK